MSAKGYKPGSVLEGFLSWGLEEQAAPEAGKELPTTVKSEEEVAKFTVDEHLNDVERTILFLNGGQIIQQKHAIANLPSVIKGRGRQAWESLAVPLKAALNRLDTECQIEAAEVFAVIAKERLMSPMDLQACLLPTIVRNINKEKSEEETEAWLIALFELVPMLDKEVLKSEVLSLALSKGDVEDNVNSRVICARILGAIAPYLTKDEVERGFLKRALAMSQDVDYLVRLSVCQQLGPIGRTVGKEMVLRSVLEELFELLKDEESQVRAAAFSALVSLLDLVPPDVRKVKVMPVLRNHMLPFDLDAVMQQCIAKHFGQMLSVVKSDFEGDDAATFYGCFKHLVSKSDVELRRNCATQLASVLKAATALQPNAFSAHFPDILQTLSTDEDEEVRLSVASQFHDIARCATRDTACSLLARPLARLLRDESSKVQAAVLPNLNTSLQQIASEEGPKKEAALDDLVKALLHLEAGCSRNWRLQAALASSFSRFAETFTSDQIYEHFLPMAYRFLLNSAAAVRPAAAEGIACFLRYNRKDKQRADIFLKLIREYARGKGYLQRMAFGEVCVNLVKRFSSKFVKEWVFDLCLELLYDPVPNVRLHITRILPALKQTIKLPEDVDLLERLNNAISNSMTDNDRDVSVTARLINETYKRTPVRMGGGIGLLDNSGGAQAAYEAEDRRREAEEVDFTFSPEDGKEIKAEIVQMNYKKKSGAPEAKPPAGARRAGLLDLKGAAGPARAGSGGPASAPSPSGSRAPAAPSSSGTRTAAADTGLRGGLAGRTAGAASPSLSGRISSSAPVSSPAASASARKLDPGQRTGSTPTASPAKAGVSSIRGGVGSAASASAVRAAVSGSARITVTSSTARSTAGSVAGKPASSTTSRSTASMSAGSLAARKK